MFEALKKIRPLLIVCEPISRAYSVESVHTLSERPKPDEIIRSLKWNGPCDGQHLILIDDVITTGDQFKACQKLAQENSPSLSVIGVFWAKTIWTDDDGQ